MLHHFKAIFATPNLLVIVLVFSVSIDLFGQKTLGVGTTIPNPNAALHVESPTRNQGIIIPRLTTAERAGMALSASDVGLIVYDTDLLDIVTWTGTGWDIAGVSSSASPAVNALTTGTGTAGTFTVNNTSNKSAAIYATTNGTLGSDVAGSAAILAETSTAFSAITGRVTAGQSNAISGITKSSDPGSWAGLFSAETGTAVYASTNSNVGGVTAPVGVYGESTGTGSSAASFRINNAANTYSALFAETNGTGSTAFFTQTNTTAWSPALVVRTDGQGAALGATSTSTSVNANAAEFVVQNATNPRYAVYATTQGTGASILAETSTGFATLHAKRDGATNGNAGLFDITNAANTYSALQVNTLGTGSAGNFKINNSGSTNAAIYAETNGTGAAISGDNTSTGDVVSIVKTGTVGSAGNFQVTNATNTASALFAMTNAGSGYAIGAINNAQGNALAIFTGGLKVSTFDARTLSSITTRAMAYEIDTNATLSFTLNEGETFYVFNSAASSSTLNGISIPANSGRVFIVIRGTLRGF